MARRFGIGRRTYDVFIAAYTLAWIGLFVWGKSPAITVAFLILPPLHFIASAARLANEGLNFWLCLLIVPVVNFGAPIGICISIAGSNSGSGEAFIYAIMLFGIPLFIVINLLVSVLCSELGRPKSVSLAQPAVTPQTRQGPAWVDTKDGRRLWVDTSNEP